MAIDGVLIALLSNATAVAFGLAAAATLFRASAGSSSTGIVRRSVRFSLRGLGAFVLFVVAVSSWDAVRSLGGQADGSAESASTVSNRTIDAAEGVRIAAEVASLRTADTEEDARAATERLVDRLRDEGLDDAEVVEVVRAATAGPDAPAVPAEWLRPLPAEADSSPGSAADSLARAYAVAIERADRTAADTLREGLVAAFAADTIAALSERVDGLETRNERLAAELETEREAPEQAGFRLWLRSAANELGLSFGWAILYFTVALTLWHGRTPGKRLLGIRVLRLTGEPITWRVAFDRAGGYTASAATALIGFARILWDPNRQAMHDKVVDTVVVRD